jgi:hypothetical protein
MQAAKTSVRRGNLLAAASAAGTMSGSRFHPYGLRFGIRSVVITGPITMSIEPATAPAAAVIVAVPKATPVTTPLLVTVAIEVLEDDQTKVTPLTGRP